MRLKFSKLNGNNIDSTVFLLKLNKVNLETIKIGIEKPEEGFYQYFIEFDLPEEMIISKKTKGVKSK